MTSSTKTIKNSEQLSFGLLLHGIPRKQQVFEKDESLFLAGEKPKWLYLIEQGKVILKKEVFEVSKAVVSVHTTGELVGDVAVLAGCPYDTDAVALTKVTASQMNGSDFLFAVRNNPVLSGQIIANLAIRLRQAQQTIFMLSTQKVERRLAALLLTLIGRFSDRTDEGIILDSSFNRYDLAAMAGTTIETTVRVLSSWAQEGIIKKHRRQIIILNIHRLGQIAQGNA